MAYDQDIVTPSLGGNPAMWPLVTEPFYWMDCVMDKKKWSVEYDQNHNILPEDRTYKFRRVGCMATFALTLALAPSVNGIRQDKSSMYRGSWPFPDWRLGVIDRIDFSPPRSQKDLQAINKYEAHLFNKMKATLRQQ
ncbi:MAG: hypothetical protein Q9227_001334 [Pyrenula ochraceoflavens]